MLPKISHMFRVTKDVEVKYTNSGIAIAELSLVSSKKFSDKEYKVFLPGKAFKKTAELLASVSKGHRIYVYGELQTETWDKEGQMQYKTVLYINEFEYVEPKQNNQGQQNQGGFQNQQNNFQQQQQNQNNQGFQQQDNLPF